MRHDRKEFQDGLSEIRIAQEILIKVMHLECSDHEIRCQFSAQERKSSFPTIELDNYLLDVGGQKHLEFSFRLNA